MHRELLGHKNIEKSGRSGRLKIPCLQAALGLLDRLSPAHEKLVQFTNLAALFDKDQPELTEWNQSHLRRHYDDML